MLDRGGGLRLKPILDCKSSFVIYCLNDLTCKKQNVGSCDNMKARLSNYKSHIKLNKPTCSFVKHFRETDSHKSVHPCPSNPKEYNKLLHREFEVIIIDQLLPIAGDSQRQSIRKLRKLEGDWQARLQTYEPHGLNTREEWKPQVNPVAL